MSASPTFLQILGEFEGAVRGDAHERQIPEHVRAKRRPAIDVLYEKRAAVLDYVAALEHATVAPQG